MVELHQYPAIWGLPSLSPFCIKVEMFLRKRQIPYRVVVEKNPARGPKGKMPFVRDGASVIPDSTHILMHLNGNLGVKKNPDALASAQAHAFQRLAEEHLYFVLLYSRWIDPVGWEVLKKEFTPLFPPLIGAPFLRLIRGQLKRQAFEQGLGRHSREEVYEMGRRDLDSIASYLGEKPYFSGHEWGEIDATLYSFLITILKQPIESELKSCLREHGNLVHYCRREESSCFPEFTGKPS